MRSQITAYQDINQDTTEFIGVEVDGGVLVRVQPVPPGGKNLQDLGLVMITRNGLLVNTKLI